LRRVSLACAVVLAGAAAVAPRALAQPLAQAAAPGAPPGPQSARADALFAQGKAALEAGDYAHACPSLQESYSIDPANGTLLALALCHEGVGRSATAWRELTAAADGAAREGRDDRAQFARAHAARLEPRLSKLTVVVPPGAPPGLGVEVDGAPLAESSWGRAFPMDPGHHTIAAHAPGRGPWSAGVDLGVERDAQIVTLVPLAPLVPEGAPPAAGEPPAAVPGPSPAPSYESTVAAPPRGAWMRPAGWIAGGAGILALGAGSIFGVAAITKSADARSRCSPASCTDAGAVAENDDAKTAATIADVAIGVGIAAVAAGAYLLLAAPSSSPPSQAAPRGLRVLPLLGRAGGGFSLQASF
jgi:hypothetical protein